MPKQQELAGIKRPINKRVAAVGEKHADAISACSKASTKRKDTKLDLIRVMREEKVTSYVDLEANPPIVIDLSDEPKVKISKYKGAVDSDEKRETKKKSKRSTDEADVDEGEIN